MRFSLHGGSAEEEEALKKFAERLGAGFVAYKALEGEEPLLVIQCLPRRPGLVEALEQMARWLDEGPLSERAAGVQNPLPGLETPHADDPPL